MKIIILPFTLLFLNVSLYSFQMEHKEKYILSEKSNSKNDKKQSEKDKSEGKNSDDEKESLKEKIKEKLRIERERKEGGRFGDRRF